jgi:hypothetical protein
MGIVCVGVSGVSRAKLVQCGYPWRAVVDTIMNLLFAQMAANFSTT